MQVLKHNINQKLYEGEFILNTKPQSLDWVIYNHYIGRGSQEPLGRGVGENVIKLDGITGQSWTAYSDIFTLVLELNPHILANGGTSGLAEGEQSEVTGAGVAHIVIEGERLFMPAPLTKSADGRIKLWD